MNAISAWLLSANIKLNSPDLTAVYEQQTGGYLYKVFPTGDSCWLAVSWPSGSRIAFRMAYSPDDQLELKKIEEQDGQVSFLLGSLLDDIESCRTFIIPLLAAGYRAAGRPRKKAGGG